MLSKKISIALSFAVAMSALAEASQANVLLNDTFTDLSNWTVAGSNGTSSWNIATVSSNSNTYASCTVSAPPASLTHQLSSAITGSWSIDFDYDYRWGGNPGTGTGHYASTITVEMVDTAGNGYAVVVHQGSYGTSSNIPANSSKLIQIYKVTNGTLATTALSSGTGYNRTGFRSIGATDPNLTPIQFTWDQDTNLLSAYYNDGSGLVLSTSATVASNPVTSFTTVVIRTDGWSSSIAPAIDNVKVQTVPEAASLSILGLGLLALSRRSIR